MDDKEQFLFSLKSPNNEYILSMKIIDEEKVDKLEIKLKHKLSSGNLFFLLRNTQIELIRDNQFLSIYNSIDEIFDCFVKIIKSQHIKIQRYCSSYYYINLFDEDNKINFSILIPRMMEDNEETEHLKEIMKQQEQSIKKLKNEIDILSGEKIFISNGYNPYLNKENPLNKEIKKDNNNLEEEDEDTEKLFIPKVQDISNKKDKCNCFTVFKNNKEMVLIFWSVEGKGVIYLHIFKTNTNYSQNVHSKELNNMDYFQDKLGKKDYLITLSQMDNDVLKIWEIDEEKEIKLILRRKFQNDFFDNNIVDLFCTFNCDKYNKNTFLFVYCKVNRVINSTNNNQNQYNNQISLYQLDKKLNIINWEFFDDEKKKYCKIINNYFKINYLDVYYDSNNNELYLINCNKNNIEIITQPEGYYRGMNFKYENWESYSSAFIKEIKGKLKLYTSCPNGIIIWDINNNLEHEKVIILDNIEPLNIIPLKNDSFFILEINKYHIMNNNYEIISSKDKSEGNSRIKSFNISENAEYVLIIDNYQLKCWTI